MQTSAMTCTGLVRILRIFFKNVRDVAPGLAGLQLRGRTGHG